MSGGADSTIRTTYREAIRAAIREALERDPRVILMGEDVGRYGGCYAVSRGLLADFGPERVRDTPLSESAFVGAGIGAAMGGLRPIVEVMTCNFSLLALDQIVNHAATLLHMSGGQLEIPLVVRMATGAGRQLAAQHSHSFEGWFAHIPGIKILAPATIEDARGMLWPALEDPNPVILFEHVGLYNLEGELTPTSIHAAIDRAVVRRSGSHVSLITYGGTLGKTMQAAEVLAQGSIEAEVLDLRTLRPLDTEAILATAAKTRRVVIVDEGWKSGSISAEITARIVEGGFYELDAPIARVCTAEVPIPYAKHLEDAALPQVASIVQAARETLGSMPDFQMPSLGADMDAGTLVEWLVKPGDAVRRGQVVANVETAKGIVEVETWQDGVVEQIVVQPGSKVPVGTVLARIGATGEAGHEGALPQTPAQAVHDGASPQTPAQPVLEAAPAPVLSTAARPSASPAARRRARELEVDLATLAGTGPHGAISASDVERAASAKAAAKAAPAAEAPTSEAARALSMRRAIAATMARSKREIPHYYLATDIDMARAIAWLEAENRRRPIPERLLPAVLELKAVALALREVPELNGFWLEGAFRASEAAHVGVAISLRNGGLVAPAIHDVAGKSLGELMVNLRDLTRRARAGTLRSSEMTDPTITVTSLGDQGVEVVYGIIYPPQVALIGLGKVTERPWAASGMLGVRPVLTATLSADHRASDGHRGGVFLRALSRILQEPEKL